VGRTVPRLEEIARHTVAYERICRSVGVVVPGGSCYWGCRTCSELRGNALKIGAPKEIEPGESRVAMTPDSAAQLQKAGL
jgi:hypothetical protein